MPVVHNQGLDIFYEDSGAGSPVVLGHSFLCSGRMWREQVPALDTKFRVINPDFRGNRRTVWHLVQRYGERADLSLPAHPHMLRHACGYELANQGADTRLIQDYLGHRNIQHTVQYTAANSARFEKLWR